jgi:transposase-like protein
MIHRLSGNKAISAHALSKEVGVPQTTLSTWLRDASVVGLEVSQKATNGFLETVSHHTTNTAKRPKEWTPEQKLQAVLEASQLSEEAFGAFLRKNGLHESNLKQWRLEMLGGLKNTVSNKKSKGKSAETKRIRQLERELTRKDKALAETAALLVLKKKVQAIWGDEDDGIPPRNAK